MNKICVIGNFGSHEETTSGQIIRTRILKQSLCNHYGQQRIRTVNVYGFQKHFLKIALELFQSILYCHIYIIILSRNGMRMFFPLMYLFQKLFRKRIFNNLVGGNFDTWIDNHRGQIKYVNSFDVNWVQMSSLKKKLEERGIKNLEVLPNSKPLKILGQASKYYLNEYHFCTFSRVCKEKGIELAINTIKEINSEAGKQLVSLTIFGKPDEQYKEEFSRIISAAPKYIRYGGVVDINDTVACLSKFYMLLFPTTWEGEGFPGTIIDSYASGLPVIASTWQYNSELITKDTGLLYDYTNESELKDKILWAINNPEIVDCMRNACLLEARKYTPEIVDGIIFRRIDTFQNHGGNLV